MAAITTKGTLETALGKWLHRSTLSSYYEDWEGMAEEVFMGPVRDPEDAQLSGLRTQITRTTGTLSTSNAYISRPSDFLAAQTFRLTGDPLVFVEYVSNEFLNGVRRIDSGMPRYYTVTDVIEFDCVPDSAYAYEMAYFPGVGTSMVGAATGTTNAILTNHANCYLALCLHFAYDFVDDAQNSQKWLNRYKLYAENANSYYRESRMTQGALQSRADVSTY